MSHLVETPGPLHLSRLLVRQQARAAGFDVANDAKCTFRQGLTLPLEIAFRCDDNFSNAFLRACATAELCFRPSTSEFGYWFAHKLASYYQHGLDAPRTGVMVVHVFDVMISAYRDVDIRAGPELVEYTKLRDTQPVEYAVEWLYKTKTFAPWRLVEEPAEGFEVGYYVPSWFDAQNVSDAFFNEGMARSYDEACRLYGRPTDWWLPGCSGVRGNVEERDYFAFIYAAGDDVFSKILNDWNQTLQQPGGF